MSNIQTEIQALKDEWGDELVILAHHYQRSSVVRYADATGDSLELARKAASHKEARRIIFCGVRFMAESADILTSADQIVYMPEPAAGCPMARMASAPEAAAAWEALQAAGNDWLPVVYVNSTADIKALCGARGGSACTSSNAARVFEWVFAQNKRVFFLPDEHLGVNTAHDLGIPDEVVKIYDPALPNGGLTDSDLAEARVVVWKGFCIVHVAFTVDHIQAVRSAMPEAKIIVHPEAPQQVVRLADAHGSTSQIIDYVENAPDGSVIVVGTEHNLVERLAEQQQGRVSVKALTPSICANMSKTHEMSLLNLLRNMPAENEIHVASDVTVNARKALERMLQL